MHNHHKNQSYMNQDYYLWLGYEILKSIQNRTRAQFGYIILNNVVTGEQGDYMPSYFLAETCKYLLLLFDFDNNPLHQMENEYIFTTEGHIFPFYSDMRQYFDSVLSSNEQLNDMKKDDLPYLVYENADEHWGTAENRQEAGHKPKRKTDALSYNVRSIVNSAKIESIFIFQNAQNAICPSSPFYVYMLMHHDENAMVYPTSKSEDGMSYLWTWLHAMFGPKDQIYEDKQVSTIYQCPIPPVQFSLFFKTAELNWLN